MRFFIISVIVIVLSIVHAFAQGGNTCIAAQASPIVIGTTYSGQTTSTVSGLAAGNYVVTVTDSKGCTNTGTAAIISPPALIGQFTKSTANCTGCGCKEWIFVTAKGGTDPYNYLWTGGYVNRFKNHLCPGTYSINIKDKNGCSINVSLTAP